jgi:hypothetical protein
MKNLKILVALPLLLIPLIVQGCWMKPIIKSANDLAYDLCIAENAKGKVGISAEDIGKAFCATEIALKPFLDAILSAKAKLHAASASASVSAAPSAKIVVVEKIVPAACPSASASVAPAPSASAKPEPKLVMPRKAAKAAK